MPVIFGTLMAALTGNTDCKSIEESINYNIKNILNELNNDYCIDKRVSRDVIRKTVMLANTENFNNLMKTLISLSENPNERPILALDGQYIAATSENKNTNPHAANSIGILSLFNVKNMRTVAQQILDRHDSESKVGPDFLNRTNIEKAIITADAASCSGAFINAVIEGNADYCIALKGNQGTLFEDTKLLFQSEDNQIVYKPDLTLDHGRIEQITAYLIQGNKLPKEYTEKFRGLKEGSFVKIEKYSYDKAKSKERKKAERYFITSLSSSEYTIEEIVEIIRQHWRIENCLHWKSDMHFDQDRMQAKNLTYIENRSCLNKHGLFMLEKYRQWLIDTEREKSVSIHVLKQRCSYSIKVATECLALAFGLIP